MNPLPVRKLYVLCLSFSKILRTHTHRTQCAGHGKLPHVVFTTEASSDHATHHEKRMPVPRDSSFNKKHVNALGQPEEISSLA